MCVHGAIARSSISVFLTSKLSSGTQTCGRFYDGDGGKRKQGVVLGKRDEDKKDGTQLALGEKKKPTNLHFLTSPRRGWRGCGHDFGHACDPFDKILVLGGGGSSIGTRQVRQELHMVGAQWEGGIEARKVWLPGRGGTARCVSRQRRVSSRCPGSETDQFDELHQQL